MGDLASVHLRIAMKRDTFCDTLVLGVLAAYKHFGSHRGLVSCCKA